MQAIPSLKDSLVSRSHPAGFSHQTLSAHIAYFTSLFNRPTEYLICTAYTILFTFLVILREVVDLSRREHETLRPRLKPPWPPFRWFGSHGLDVTDGQWYYMVVSLPLAMPVMATYLLCSRLLSRLRDRAQTCLSPSVLLLNKDEETGSMIALQSKAGSQIYSSSLPMKHAFPYRPCISIIDEGALPTELPERASVFGDAPGNKLTFTSTAYISPDLAPTHALHLFFGLLIAFGVTGPGCLFALAFIIANYYGALLIHQHFSFRRAMMVIWGTHVSVLFLHFYVGTYRFAWLGLPGLDNLWRPVLTWTTVYNLAMLRMIAFNFDWYEALDPVHAAVRREAVLQRHESSCVECALMRDAQEVTKSREATWCYKCRTDCPRAPGQYNLLSYLGYIFYPPLYLTGPMLSFNAYFSYQQYPTRSVTRRAIWLYAIRCVTSGVLLATLMHFAHVGAILEAYQRGINGTYIVLFPSQKLILFYVLLGFIWLKLDFIWKLARLIALFDGVEPPEDMRRCFNSAVSIQDFWRDWHASFNLWIVRYIYIPMGGKSKKVRAIVVIFFFIAIWHDIDSKLLCWAALTCFFFIPEILIMSFFSSTKNKWVQRLKNRPLVWRYIRVLGGQMGVCELILINLTGFMLGTDTPTYEVGELFQKTSWTCIAWALSFSLTKVNLSVLDRDQEAQEHRALRIKYRLEM